MRVTFLGTGSAMPTGERAQTGILLEADGRTLLLDCGSGVLGHLPRTEPGYEGLDALLLTHHHLDHVSDLLPLLKARWLAGAGTLEIAGPDGTADLVADLLSVHAYLREHVDPDVRDVEAGRFELAGFDVEAAETRHSMDCLAYRLAAGDADGQAFAFSGDTEAFPGLIAFADGAAVLAHDCSFPDGIDVSNHPTPSELGEALAEADAEIGRVYLTHLYPHTDGKHGEMLDAIRERYDGDVRFAHDGLSVEVS